MHRQTLFDIDMKTAAKNPNFKPGVMYDVMLARKDAHFFDFSPAVTGEILETLLKFPNTADVPECMPPVRKGFYRFNFTTNVFKSGNGEEFERLNSVLVDGSKVYFFQEHVGGDLKLYPFMVDIKPDNTNGLRQSSFHDGKKIDFDPTKYESAYDYKVTTIGTNNFIEDFEQDFKSISGFTAFMYLAFATLYETKALTVECEQIESKWSSNNNKAFYTKTTLVKIAMSRVRNKYLKRSEPTGRKMPWGEVRSHFAHWRVTDPNCEHQWHDRTGEGQKFKCDKCGEIKTLRKFPQGRGNKQVGIIKTNYEVSQT